MKSFVKNAIKELVSEAVAWYVANKASIPLNPELQLAVDAIVALLQKEVA